MTSQNIQTSTLDLLVIVASTGGPVAIQSILLGISKTFPIPILVVQHMPADFTGSFSERLDKLCYVHVKEACEGDFLRRGTVLIAPGGKQLRVCMNSSGNAKIICLSENSENNFYSPCADITLSSIAQVYKERALAIILTGMGSDGCEGAKDMVKVGAEVWAQDEASSIIYGMPKAVIEAGVASHIYSLNVLADILSKPNI